MRAPRQESVRGTLPGIPAEEWACILGRNHIMWSFAAAALELPPAVIVSSIVVAATLAWALRFVFRRLEQLEAGTRTSGAQAYFEDPSSLLKVPFPSIFAPAELYLTLVVPAFDEEARLGVTLDETLRYLQDRADLDGAFTYEVIVVDDGSRDATARVAFEYVRRHTLERVRLLRQGVNQGKGAAVRKGMLCSRGRLLLFMDADGATKITELIKLENEAKMLAGKQAAAQGGGGGGGQSEPKGSLEGASVAVFGSRAHMEQQALAKRKWLRNVLMHGFHFCVLLAGGSSIRDTQCGFKIFTRGAARQLFPNQRLNRWCFDVELVYLCQRLGIPMAEIAVSWTEIPGSKIRVTSILHMLLELFLIRVGYGLMIWKIHRSYVAL